jgi:lipooligosaccharide transport system permease protein
VTVATTHVLRLVEREARVYRKLWRGSAFTSFVTPLLYLASIGIGLGGIVDAHNRSVSGLTYLEFVTPGLLAASAVQAASGDSLWPVMAGFKWMGHYNAMISSPASPADVYTGAISWIALRTTLSATAFLAIAAALGGVTSPWAVLAILAAVAGALAFAAPLAAFAVTQETDVAFPVVMRLAVIPLFLFSGTFFPVSQLPGWGQGLVVLSPLWHAVELCRSATTGHAGWPALGHVAALLLCIGVGVYAGRRNFHRRLTP